MTTRRNSLVKQRAILRVRTAGYGPTRTIFSTKLSGRLGHHLKCRKYATTVHFMPSTG